MRASVNRFQSKIVQWIKMKGFSAVPAMDMIFILRYEER